MWYGSLRSNTARSPDVSSVITYAVPSTVCRRYSSLSLLDSVSSLIMPMLWGHGVLEHPDTLPRSSTAGVVVFTGLCISSDT